MQRLEKLPVVPAGLLTVTISMLLGSMGSAKAQQLEEILVTAERREMDLQETPISVMSFDQETLELAGVDDMFEIANLTPNLDIKGARGTGNTSPIYEIRGISGGGGATGERSVGFYIDNVFMPRTTGPVMRVLDVERVEVLRGPQGTLFGRNSTGGAIRVFSKQPSAERDGYLRATLGNQERQDLAAMINVPLTDQLFLRAQGAYLSEDGFVQRGPQALGDSEDTVARLQLGWHPSDTVSATFGLMYTDSDSNGSPTEMTQFNMNPVCPTDPSNPYVCWQGNYADWVSDFLQTAGQERLREDDPRLVLDDFTMPSWCFLDDVDPDWDELCRQWNKAEYKQFDANVTWDISDRVTMVSTTGLSDFSSSGVSDWQLMGMEFRPSSVESEVFYQEIQFNFSLGDRVDFVTGVNYFQEDSSAPREALYNAIGSSNFAFAGPAAGTGGTANGNLWGCNDSLGIPCAGTVRRLRVTGDNTTDQTSTAYGLFANATIHLGKIVNLTLGARESYDEKELSNTLFANDTFIPETGNSTTVSAKDDWNATDWRATLDFQITDDFMLYVTSSEAFRSGTFSVPAPVCANAGTCTTFHRRPQPALVPPETLLNDEIGFRSEWLDGRFRFNATYYDMEYTDRQGAAAQPDPTATTGFIIVLTNQGDVDLWGSEIEAMFAVTDRLTMEASAGHANFEMANVCINNGPYLFPPPMDREYTLSGRYELPTQRGNYTIALTYTDSGPMQTHPGGFTDAERAQYPCFASFPTQAAADFAASFIDSRYEVPSYNILNAALRFSSNSGKWMATLFANNLTDEVYANNAQSFGRGFWTAGGPPGTVGPFAAPRGAVADYRGRPREYGLTFQYNFF
jgi:iron complex outermembrane receptor protein